jgi:hypothetical protein
MDLEVLKKKISTYRTEGGKLTKVSDEVIIEILLAWEQWTGPASGFYTAIGVSNHRKMASILGKAKKLRREGFPTDGFKEIKVIGSGAGTESSGFSGPCSGIELSWDKGKLIRFKKVDELVEFLKKAA